MYLEGIINPLPSQLEEVYTHYLSVIEEGEMDSSKASGSSKEEIVLQF
jgi:hypothetical protein